MIFQDQTRTFERGYVNCLCGTEFACSQCEIEYFQDEFNLHPAVEKP